MVTTRKKAVEAGEDHGAASATAKKVLEEFEAYYNALLPVQRQMPLV